jgi:uncharacterized membrane protein
MVNVRAAIRRRSGSETLHVPWWLPALSLFVAVAGIGVAIYLTIAHFDESVSLACSDNGTVNCGKVTTSDQSYFLGLPVAVLGLAYFVGIVPLLVSAAWRSPLWVVRAARVVASAIGILFIIRLVYAEMFWIHAICLWCTAVHVLTFLLFVVILFGTAITAPYNDDEDDFEEFDEADSSDMGAGRISS